MRPLLRVCNVTAAVEEEDADEYGYLSDHPPVKKLLRCARCRGVYYVSQVEQREDWKYHQFYCRRLSLEDKSRIDSEYASDSYSKITWFFNRPNSVSSHMVEGSELSYRLLRFEERYRKQTYYSSAPNHVISDLDWNVSDSYLRQIWACPGVAGFFLSLDLTTPYMRRQKSAIDLRMQCFNPKHHLPPSYCDFMLRLYGLFALGGCVDPSTNQIRTYTRTPDFARAMARKFVNLWTNPRVLKSIPAYHNLDYRNARQYYGPRIGCSLIEDDGAIFPSKFIGEGLTTHAAIMVAATERTVMGRDTFQRFTDAILKSTITRRCAWDDHFSIEERAECALALVRLIPQNLQELRLLSYDMSIEDREKRYNVVDLVDTTRKQVGDLLRAISGHYEVMKVAVDVPQEVHTHEGVEVRTTEEVLADRQENSYTVMNFIRTARKAALSFLWEFLSPKKILGFLWAILSRKTVLGALWVILCFSLLDMFFIGDYEVAKEKEDDLEEEDDPGEEAFVDCDGALCLKVWKEAARNANTSQEGSMTPGDVFATLLIRNQKQVLPQLRSILLSAQEDQHVVGDEMMVTLPRDVESIICEYAGNPCSALLTWNFPSVLNRYQTSRWENFEPKNEAEWTKLKRLAPYAASTAHVTPKGDDGIWK